MVCATQPANGVNTVCIKAMPTIEDRGHSECSVSDYYEISNYNPNHASGQDSVTETGDLYSLRF